MLKHNLQIFISICEALQQQKKGGRVHFFTVLASRYVNSEGHSVNSEGHSVNSEGHSVDCQDMLTKIQVFSSLVPP